MTRDRKAPRATHASAADEPCGKTPSVGATDPVWLRIETAAALVDLTPAALRKRLARAKLPAGLVTHMGWSVRIHKALFLAWVASGAVSADATRISA